MADTFIVPNSGERWALKAYADKFTSGGKIRLFKNNATLTATMVVGDLTEADFAGYAEINAAWAGDPVTDSNGKAVIFHAPCQWTKSGATGNTIYGWYLIDDASYGDLQFVYKWDATKDMSDDGDQITFFPFLRAVSE